MRACFSKSMSRALAFFTENSIQLWPSSPHDGYKAAPSPKKLLLMHCQDLEDALETKQLPGHPDIPVQNRPPGQSTGPQTGAERTEIHKLSQPRKSPTIPLLIQTVQWSVPSYTYCLKTFRQVTAKGADYALPWRKNYGPNCPGIGPLRQYCQDPRSQGPGSTTQRILRPMCIIFYLIIEGATIFNPFFSGPPFLLSACINLILWKKILTQIWIKVRTG